MIDQRNFTYMFYGFAAAWAIVVVYVVFLALREKKLRQELDRVRRMVERADDRKPGDRAEQRNQTEVKR